MATAAHLHLAPGSDALVEAAAEAMEAAGIAWTDLRAAIYSELARAGRPVSAYDVSEFVSQRLHRRIAANSVYRILDLFVRHNLAMRVESRNAYVANTHPGCRHGCVFLVCEGCGAIGHVDDDAAAAQVRDDAKAAGFTVRRTVIELLGLCQACNG
jgi:Fur family zinc uptake transcriptional regulator